MKILLIGGGGYLGIPLAYELKEQKHYVFVYDAYKYETKPFIDGIVENKQSFVRDIIDSNFNVNNFDVVIYLAQPRLGELDGKEQINDAIHDFKIVLNNLNGPKLFFISSCSVYGKTDEIANENTNTMITSLYSEMKIECEKLLKEKNNKNYYILRLATLYGYSYNYNRTDVFINNIIEDICKNNVIEIFDPLAKRPHLHVLDCAKIISELTTTELEHNILNIGFNNLNINKLDLIKIIQNIESFEFLEHLTKDSRDYSVDFTLLSKYVNYPYYIDYENGVLNYLNHKKIIVN